MSRDIHSCLFSLEVNLSGFLLKIKIIYSIFDTERNKQ
jgi:hypothetical protein